MAVEMEEDTIQTEAPDTGSGTTTGTSGSGSAATAFAGSDEAEGLAIQLDMRYYDKADAVVDCTKPSGSFCGEELFGVVRTMQGVAGSMEKRLDRELKRMRRKWDRRMKRVARKVQKELGLREPLRPLLVFDHNGAHLTLGKCPPLRSAAGKNGRQR